MNHVPGWTPPLLKLYPGVRRAAEEELDSVIPRADQQDCKAGTETEYHFIRLSDGRLVRLTATIAADDTEVMGEIYASSGESVTDADVFRPGFYNAQHLQLHGIIRRVHDLAEKHECGVLLATAGMPLDVPDRWNPDTPGHLDMIASSDRYRRMATHAHKWHGQKPPTLTTRDGGTIVLLPIYGGTAASFQANYSWPLKTFAYWRRALLATAAVSHAFSVGSPLLLGKALNMHSHRVSTFPGAYYGMDPETEWPRYFSLAPGGYLYEDGKPLDGAAAVRKAYLAQLHENRPFLAAPPTDWEPHKLTEWAQKSCYAGSRVRLGGANGKSPAYVRMETRWTCVSPTPWDNIAVMYGIKAVAAGFTKVYGDGANLRYRFAEANFRNVVRDGVAAQLEFPGKGKPRSPRPVIEVAEELLEAGYDWHIEKGFKPDEIMPLHNALRCRLQQRRPFSQLLLDWVTDSGDGKHAPDAFAMYKTVERWGSSNVPFHRWPKSWKDAEHSTPL